MRWIDVVREVLVLAWVFAGVSWVLWLFVGGGSINMALGCTIGAGATTFVAAFVRNPDG